MLDAGEVMRRGRNKTGKSLIELIVIWIAIFIIAGFFLGRANMFLLKAREATLKNELNNLRLAVSLYYILYKTYPDNIETLIDKAYEIHARKGSVLKGKFLNNLKYNREGKLKDPFGKIYVYNPQSGMVKSQTVKYKDW